MEEERESKANSREVIWMQSSKKTCTRCQLPLQNNCKKDAMNTFLIIGMQLRTIISKPERLARLHIVASFQKKLSKPERLARLHIVASFQKKLHLYTEIFHLQHIAICHPTHESVHSSQKGKTTLGNN